MARENGFLLQATVSCGHRPFRWPWTSLFTSLEPKVDEFVLTSFLPLHHSMPTPVQAPRAVTLGPNTQRKPPASTSSPAAESNASKSPSMYACLSSFSPRACARVLNSRSRARKPMVASGDLSLDLILRTAAPPLQPLVEAIPSELIIVCARELKPPFRTLPRCVLPAERRDTTFMDRASLPSRDTINAPSKHSSDLEGSSSWAWAKVGSLRFGAGLVRIT